MIEIQTNEPRSVVLLAHSEKEREECEKGIQELEVKWRPLFSVEMVK